MTFKDYAELLDWTGRAIRTDKRGAIPEQLMPIFDRLQLQESHWRGGLPLDTVGRWGESFYYLIGPREHVQSLCAQCGGGRPAGVPGRPKLLQGRACGQRDVSSPTSRLRGPA